MNRRDFLKTALLSGGILLLPGFAAPGRARTHTGSWRPAYFDLEEKGRFAQRIRDAYAMFEKCELCPRRCGVNRAKGETGVCRATDQVVVYSRQPHFGEELPLVGRHGSGTIFFSNCNLRCVFCQNWPIAHEGRGTTVSDEMLAEMMIQIQNMGCHNINVVTPTHVMPNILNATRIAMKKGLRLPICYNTGGYERTEAVRMLDGIVDIYLPDLKFMDPGNAARFAGDARDYPENARAAIIEMNRQVGDTRVNPQGVATRGLMIRHLVMPNRVAGTREFVQWVSENLPPETYINIMSQYRVEHRAFEYPEIARAITPEEYVEAIDWAKSAGLSNLDARSASQYESMRRRMGSGEEAVRSIFR